MPDEGCVPDIKCQALNVCRIVSWDDDFEYLSTRHHLPYAGGSGFQAIRAYANFPELLGGVSPAVREAYDLISWDPRGWLELSFEGRTWLIC